MRQTTRSITAFQIRREVRRKHNIIIAEKHFKVIWELFSQRVIDRLTNGEKFQMGKMGSIYISATRGKAKLTDWKATRKMWDEFTELKAKRQSVYHLSENTIYHMIWSRSNRPNFYSRFMYRIRISNNWRKCMEKAITVDKKEYR